VTRIPRAAQSLGLANEIRRAISTQGDWGTPKTREGHVADLQQPKPDEYVVASGEMHLSVIFWKAHFSASGSSLQVRGRRSNLIRPTDIDRLVGDATKAKTVLGWKPEVSFDRLIDDMVESDLRFYSDRKSQS
jgi:GDPmannose 4,6-dehydratase